ncbi:Helitron helicase [Phytophthora megakarya]|uniref:Helitron helicase n=1 Tax=Phytophthora megakarya TaxID=4795 RepID=A0A225VQ95_9STRA|nr:Helitron helicase [Phytophthora megakarya]
MCTLSIDVVILDRRIRFTSGNSFAYYKAVVDDNQWVVPYNPYLCQKYNCHINVEICSTVQSVKYLYKYVYKEQDRATVTLRPRQQTPSISSENDGVADRYSIDEIQQYLDGRYLSPPEACWTIFRYDMQEKSHHVHQLPVHEERKQLVHYSTTAAIQDIVEYNQFTRLTACVEWIQPKVQLPENYFMDEVPIYFVWNNRENRYHWSKCSRGGDNAISRMISVSPSEVNRYYLRILLCYRRGPTSYENLRTVDGVVHETYKDTALAMGLLE